MKHDSHPEIIARLKQAHGHIGGILTMLADGRPCADLAQQLQAVESVIRSAKRTLIQDHMEHCIADAAQLGGAASQLALREFKSMSKYL
jgi:uncharacterized protein